MSRCAFPSLLLSLGKIALKIPIPKIPKLPIPPMKLKGFSLGPLQAFFAFGLPGRPTISFNLIDVDTSIPFPKLPKVPRFPNLSLPGRPGIVFGISKPNIHFPKAVLPKLPTLSCPLDVREVHDDRR